MNVETDDDLGSQAVEHTYASCKFVLDTILVSLRCPTCDKESKVTSQLGMLLLHLQQEPDATNVARDLRQYLLRARKSAYVPPAIVPQKEIPLSTATLTQRP